MSNPPSQALAKPLPIAVFALVSLAPLAGIGLAGLWGGAWAWGALAWMGLAAVAIDLCLPWVAQDADSEFPGSDLLLAVIGTLALAMMPLLVWAVLRLGGLQGLALALAGGLWLGQVGHPAAHELIHRPGRGLRALGGAVYAVLLFGHHASAHRLVHHRHVASDQDPNSARQGEGYYRFALRAWPGSIRAGLAAERALRGHGGAYRLYALGALAGLGCGWALGGMAGLLVWAGLGLHFGAQVLLSDYVQHYGLRRGPSERVGLSHSWNAPQWFSSALMLNAPRHSDHHAHPARPYPALRLEEGAPLLPWPLPLACLVALYPPLWRRRMARELAALTKL
ncbi:alkane 1-monooxygenase [Rhodobacter sp. KR11]|uniref:alkane 1-monooxygenase n=1 Tax=Rhodobacter sp. KR11 TaxID=2974588 RepID=UPI0022234350|nr:alkane 1-monooxygenase [Rhodobacter sp. KR11]MCW1919824.1 alkane 1-monooxygenase [Rhodobacter sp. KR11]